jgi:hypothetical protein
MVIPPKEHIFFIIADLGPIGKWQNKAFPVESGGHPCLQQKPPVEAQAALTKELDNWNWQCV